MFSRHNQLIGSLYLVLDAVLALASFGLAYLVRSAIVSPRPLYPLSYYPWIIPLAIAIWVVAGLALGIYREIREEDWRRAHLKELIQRFRQGAAQLQLPLLESTTTIQPLLLGNAERALSVSARLRERGLLVLAIRPPTVPAGSARLRITLTAAHSGPQVDQLLEALAEVMADDG